MKYCASPYQYIARKSRPVVVGDPSKGGVIVGDSNPIVVQSMLTSSTLDTEACIEQSMHLVDVGCQIIRITAQTRKYAANLEHIVSGIRSQGSNVPIVADIHFKPDAAMEAVKWCEMVRVNPGNYADTKRFITREYTGNEYQEELKRIEGKFGPLVEECKRLGRALRIGTNHGSLSDRIMSRYGDTPLGMVESALEFAVIARSRNFHNFKFSMKSSNPKVMIECYRLLAARLAELGEDWDYPLHLGVTEAGDGEDGRIKSAIGIGSLLCDGLGDTIRVSLTEDSHREIAVCKDIVNQIPKITDAENTYPDLPLFFDPFDYSRRGTPEITLNNDIRCGGEQPIRVVVVEKSWMEIAPQIHVHDDVRPEAVYENLNLLEVDPRDKFEITSDKQMVTVADGLDIPVITAFRLLAARLKSIGKCNAILLKDRLGFDGEVLSSDIALLRASISIGSLLCDGIGDAILIRGEGDSKKSLKLAYNILQAAGCRSFKTDYVACPSCGRTLFDLQEVTAKIKSRTEHLKGVKIAVMGCIVNGPGEMADADFGYVGGAPGKINLYVGREPVRFNIPETEAVESLVGLIREHDKWFDPPTDTSKTQC